MLHPTDPLVYTKAYFIEVVIMQVRSKMSDLMRIANPIIRCKQMLFGIGLKLQQTDKSSIVTRK